jgi:hypothetical protein
MVHVPSPHDPSDVASNGDAATSATGGGLTRRTVVRASAALGAAALAGSAALPAAAASRSAPGRLVVRRELLGPGTTTGPLRTPHRFDLVGAPVAALRGAGVEIRARGLGGSWSAWRPLADHDGHAPDGRRAAMSDPVWFGDAEEVELRARRRPERDVRLDLVAVNGATKRGAGRAAARAVADGGIPLRPASARAAGGSAGAQATARVAAPTIIPRSAWAAGLTPKGTPDLGQVQVAFVHHTVNGNTYAQSESAGIVRAIFDYHVNSNGWNDIGYNFLVDRFGQIFEGRAGGVEQPVIGAQAIGWNSVSTGIAIIGTFEDTAAPDAALAAVASIIRWKLPLHGVPTAGTVSLVSSGGSGNRWNAGATVAMNRISGHQDGCSTDCPGTTLYGQLPALRSRVGNVEPAAAAASGLTIVVPKDPVEYGATLPLAGRMTLGDAPVMSAVVVVEKQSPSGRWVPVAQATTDPTGDWATSIVLRSATPVRARVAETTSAAVTPVLDPALELRQPDRHPDAGRTLLVRGTARGVDEVKIVLRRRIGGRYVPVTSKTVKLAKGAFSGRVPVRRSGLHQISVQAVSGGRTFRSANRYLRARS